MQAYYENHVYGNWFDDIMWGTRVSDMLDGGAGNDTIIDSADCSFDLFVGGSGNDVLISQGGSDRLLGGRGADQFLVLGDELVFVQGGASKNDRLMLTEGNGDWYKVDGPRFTSHLEVNGHDVSFVGVEWVYM